METQITQCLKKYSIEFISHHTFDWLRNPNTGHPLILDFYLPDYNIAIECQGKQHFEPVSCFGGENEFKNIQQRDEIKYKLCRENKVDMVYIVDEKLIENMKHLTTHQLYRLNELFDNMVF
jgi:hypothetical protein